MNETSYEFTEEFGRMRIVRWKAQSVETRPTPPKEQPGEDEVLVRKIIGAAKPKITYRGYVVWEMLGEFAYLKK